MDQDSFRKLLSAPAPAKDSGKPGGASKAKSKAADASQPAFKPRKVKKSAESKYRDRATERREGKASDYAQAEALLQDFEKRTANEDKDVIEQQRRYLGGDSAHTILVKGLDLSLLEANRAKETRNTNDDEMLEAAYRGEDVSPAVVDPPPPADEPKKRSRADIIKQMKAKRQGQVPADTPAPPPKEDKEIDKSKFKSIGFKPAGDKPKKKKAKTEGDGERKKKKRKVEGDAPGATPVPAKESAPTAPVEASKPAAPAKPKEPSPEPIPDDFDIFAGAGDYDGIPDEEDGSDGERAEAGKTRRNGEGDAHRDGSAEPGEVSGHPPRDSDSEMQDTEPAVPRARWFDDEPREPVLPRRPATPPALRALKKGKGRAEVEGGSEPASPSGARPAGDDEDDAEHPPARLAPLESSAVPSIKDLLAMDEALGTFEKRQKRKEKKKKGAGGAGGLAMGTGGTGVGEAAPK
ncbi:hypothetical protein HDZ31DRAFT_72140 [Schizophyllum fasciatum]